LLRTAVIWTLHKSKKAIAEGSDAQKKATSSSALFQHTQKTLQGLIIGAWVQRQPSDIQLWEYWNEAGWIQKRPQGRVVTILDCPPSRKASHTNLTGQSIIRITYTDGAWTPPSDENPVLNPAGAGVVTFKIVYEDASDQNRLQPTVYPLDQIIKGRTPSALKGYIESIYSDKVIIDPDD
jgi:hypothetical protein